MGTQVVVDRSRWLRGDPMCGALCDGVGNYCVLGFYGKQVLGLDDNAMVNRGSLIDPVFGAAHGRWELEWLSERLEAAITSINDSPAGITLGHGQADSAREARLKALFAEHAVDLHFEN